MEATFKIRKDRACPRHHTSADRRLKHDARTPRLFTRGTSELIPIRNNSVCQESREMCLEGAWNKGQKDLVEASSTPNKHLRVLFYPITDEANTTS